MNLHPMWNYFSPTHKRVLVKYDSIFGKISIRSVIFFKRRLAEGKNNVTNNGIVIWILT